VTGGLFGHEDANQDDDGKERQRRHEEGSADKPAVAMARFFDPFLHLKLGVCIAVADLLEGLDGMVVGDMEAVDHHAEAVEGIDELPVDFVAGLNLFLDRLESLALFFLIGPEGIDYFADLALLLGMHAEAVVDHLEHVILHFACLGQGFDGMGEGSEFAEKFVLASGLAVQGFAKLADGINEGVVGLLNFVGADA